MSIARIAARSPILLGVVATGLTAASTASPLTEVADLFGGRLGMTRQAMLARMPGPCTGQADGGSEHMFVQCGARALSAGFTTSGRAWWVTASYDLTGTPYPIRRARGALETRYGRPTDLGAGRLVWLPAGSTANAEQCLTQAMLLTAALDQHHPPDGSSGLPIVSAGCLPIRSAILAEQGRHHGVIVEVRDPRARVQELER